MMRWVTIAVGAATLAGCSLIGGLFSGKENVEPPAPLTSFKAKIQVRQVWSRSVGSGAGEKALQLRPAVSADVVYAAGPKGDIAAYSLANGKQLWHVRAKARFSSGPGYGEGLVVLGTTQAEILAFNASNGKLVWKKPATSEVLAVPVINKGQVIVRTIDGRVAGYNAKTGKRNWFYARQEPLLSLRGTSSPVIAGDAVLNGFDNGMMIALKAADGKILWQKRITLPTGRSELQRLVDIDADPVVMGDTVYVGTYQGKVAAVLIETGELLWTRKMSTYAGLAVGKTQIFVTDENSEVWALDRKSGASLWKQKKLRARTVSAPVILKDYLVVGDFEGYLHWMSLKDGNFIARIRADSKGIAVKPVVYGKYLVVLGKGGELGVFTVAGTK